MTRKITDDEDELWKLATKNVKGAPSLDDFIPAKTEKKIKITSKTSLAAPRPKLKARLPELVAGTRGDMDLNSFNNMKRGNTKSEAEIDLHGMWVEQAYIAVRDFLVSSRDQGMRQVKVITGKGGILGNGKIRAELPVWLNEPDMRSIILAFSHSREDHGGTGAFYISLRKLS